MNRSTRFFIALWIVIAGSAGSPQPCRAEDPIALRDTREVTGMIVRLSDVFTGIPAESDEAIAQAPQPGKQVTYDVTVLNRIAEKYSLEWKPKSIADHVVITTTCAHITPDMLRDVVATKVKEARAASGNKVHGSIDVTFDNRMTSIDLPADHVPDFALNNFRFDQATKGFSADLVVQVTGGPFSFPIAGRATVKRTIPVLARHLETGTVISLADIDQMDVAEEHVGDQVITDAASLIGHELKHETDAGTALHTHDVIQPRSVTRGGLVTLRIETPFMSLTAQGRSMQDGATGDVVRVTNTQSNREVEGVVEGPGIVRIQTAQRLAEAQ